MEQTPGATGEDTEVALVTRVNPADERAIGAPRHVPTEAQQGGQGTGLKYGDYVPTRREIDSGAVKIQEVVAVVRSEGVETDDLEPVSDQEAAIEELAAGSLFSKDWNARFDTLHMTRKLIKFTPNSVSHLIADISKCLVECLKNPRSSILREACMLCADLLTNEALSEAVCEGVSFETLVPVLMLKSISDKKFIREAAQSAVHLHAASAPQMFQVYISSCDHKNAKIAASATTVVAKCLEALVGGNHEALTDDEFTDLTKRMTKVCLHGKLADGRKTGKRCLELLEQERDPEAMQAVLSQHCSKSDAEAVHRLLHPEAVPQQPAANCSISEFIATNSPVNSPKSSFDKSREVEPVLVIEKPWEQQPAVPAVLEAMGEPEVPEATSEQGRRRALSHTPRSRRSSEEILQLF